MSKQTFEKAMKKLVQIVQELESGDLPLEKAITKIEEGVKLSKFCSKKLDETEKKVDNNWVKCCSCWDDFDGAEQHRQ